MRFERDRTVPISYPPEGGYVVTGRLTMTTQEMQALNRENWEPVEVSFSNVTKTGRVLTDTELDRLAAPAEEGYAHKIAVCWCGEHHTIAQVRGLNKGKVPGL